MQTLLVTVDSLRADHLKQYGYRRDTMPALDSLVSDGTLYESAFANAPYTRISIPSFQTSRYLAYEDLASSSTVASLLSAADVRTAVVGTQTAIDIGEFGYDETVDLDEDTDSKQYHERKIRQQSVTERARYRVNEAATWVSQFLQRHDLDTVYNTVKRPYNALFDGSGYHYQGYTKAEDVTDRAIEWLESAGNDDFFLWIHYMDPHRPYGIHDEDPSYLNEPVSEDRIRDLMKTAGTNPDAISSAEKRLMQDLYDSDIRYCSRHIERLFDRCRELNVWEELNVFFTADHGEEFEEHGRYFHRNYPYDELMRVPLVVKAPSLVDRGDTVTEQRELLDLAPSVCSLYDLDVTDLPFEGRPITEGGSRQVVALGQPHDEDPAVTVRAEGWKYIRSRRSKQLYDLSEDPDEKRDVSDEYPDVAKRLEAVVPDGLVDREQERPREPTDEVDRERLEALGYLELQEETS